MTTPLPTPRVYLTSLIESLSTTLPTLTNQINSTPAQAVNPLYDPLSNTLKSLPASHRALLTTLHVLLPTGVLLQALDLLDRGLVVRVVEQSSMSEPKDNGGVEMIMPLQAHVHLPESSTQAAKHRTQAQVEVQVQIQDQIQAQDPPQQSPKQAGSDMTARLAPESPPKEAVPQPEKSRNKVYQVRSSQAPKSRFKDPLSSTSAANLTYTVRLEAWNCSCAAFAFEAFPGGSLGHSPWADPEDNDSHSDSDFVEMLGGEEGKGVKLEFGGLSFDGRGDGGKVPICKHLLACLLVERWEAVLGGYVKKVVLRREEMAGVGGEG